MYELTSDMSSSFTNGSVIEAQTDLYSYYRVVDFWSYEILRIVLLSLQDKKYIVQHQFRARRCKLYRERHANHFVYMTFCKFLNNLIL